MREDVVEPGVRFDVDPDSVEHDREQEQVVNHNETNKGPGKRSGHVRPELAKYTNHLGRYTSLSSLVGRYTNLCNHLGSYTSLSII